MPPLQAHLHLFAHLAMARMEAERIHYFETNHGQVDRIAGFNDALSLYQDTLQRIITQVTT